MPKSYADYMNELTPVELYEGLLAHGLFSEKLPPVFTAEIFLEYCKILPQEFSDKPRQYVVFNSMRNINVPRQLGLPTPMAYQRLCRCLCDNWGNIQNHFQNTTNNQQYKVSRIHIRKLKHKKALFEMSYTNWRTDGSPEPDLLIGKRWLVKADIATCFPSIYSHSLPWALTGKAQAKISRRNVWYNDIDHFTQQLKYGETHGLLIGPHTSNILAEIILSCIDYNLITEGWQYIRNIDDYSCYVETYEKGQQFLIRLSELLREYDLLLNHKKTEILELPIAAVKQWVRQINQMTSLTPSGTMNYKAVRSYFDSAIELMQINKDNAAILNYAVKTLKHQSLTRNAKNYCVKTVMHLSIIYPYLIPLLDENVFNVFHVSTTQIEEYARIIYQENLKQQNYEGIYYAIYFALKYNFVIDNLTVDKVKKTEDCFALLFAYKYFQKRKDKTSIKELKKYAKTLIQSDFDRYWIFLFEILSKRELSDEWKAMKNYGVTFLSI